MASSVSTLPTVSTTSLPRLATEENSFKNRLFDKTIKAIVKKLVRTHVIPEHMGDTLKNKLLSSDEDAIEHTHWSADMAYAARHIKNALSFMNKRFETIPDNVKEHLEWADPHLGTLSIQSHALQAGSQSHSMSEAIQTGTIAAVKRHATFTAYYKHVMKRQEKTFDGWAEGAQAAFISMIACATMAVVTSLIGYSLEQKKSASQSGQAPQNDTEAAERLIEEEKKAKSSKKNIKKARKTFQHMMFNITVNHATFGACSRMASALKRGADAESFNEAATVSAINASTYIIKKIVSAAISQIEDVKYDTAFSKASHVKETASATIDLDSFKIGAMIIIPALMIMGQYGLNNTDRSKIKLL